MKFADLFYWAYNVCIARFSGLIVYSFPIVSLSTEYVKFMRDCTRKGVTDPMAGIINLTLHCELLQTLCVERPGILCFLQVTFFVFK